MSELVWITLPPFGWLAWTIGGTWWKPMRRFVYPAILAVVLATQGVALWAALLTGVLSALMFSLGYGDKYTWKRRILVGLGYALSVLPLGHLFGGVLIVSAVFIVGFYISRKFNQFTWKIVEGSSGFAHAFIACLCVQIGGW